MRVPILVLVLCGLAGPAFAESPADFVAAYAQGARAGNPAARLSAERGQQFFAQTHGRDWSCSSCHTRNPATAGRHAVTSKAIEPLAPAANPVRFTRTAKVEKWFKRNCNDVLGRECTAQEKGDVLSYLLTLR